MENKKKYEDIIDKNEKSFDESGECFDMNCERNEISYSDNCTDDIQSNAKRDISADVHFIDIEPILASHVDLKLDNIAEVEQRIFCEIREIHKLYHSEFACRLKSMQDELEQYHKVEKGRVYDDILASIARIYVNNETLVDDVVEEKVRKSIKYLLLDIEDLLSIYGVTRQHSPNGARRNPRRCQILNRIPTDNPLKHDTVAKSYNSGFCIGNRTIIKEIVDIYIYDEQLQIDNIEKQTIIEIDEKVISE